MKANLIAICAFSTVTAFGVFMAWLAGYNFDERNFYVAYYIFVLSCASGVVAWEVREEFVGRQRK